MLDRLDIAALGICACNEICAECLHRLMMRAVDEEVLSVQLTDNAVGARRDLVRRIRAVLSFVQRRHGPILVERTAKVNVDELMSSANAEDRLPCLEIRINQGKLRRRDWNDFCRAIDYAGKHFKKNPACGGIVVSPLAVIEFLRQEK